MDKLKIINNFVNKEDCSFLINEIKRLNNEDKMDLMPNGRIRSWHTEFEELTEIKEKYSQLIIKQINKLYETDKSFYVSDFAYFISLEGSYMHEHIDAGDEYSHFQYSSIMYLNDDFEGGELKFSNIDYTYKPKSGDVVIFPSNDEDYVHSVNLLKSGKRYIMAMWFSLV